MERRKVQGKHADIEMRLASAWMFQSTTDAIPNSGVDAWTIQALWNY